MDTVLRSGDNAGMPREFHKHDGKFQSPVDLDNAYEVDLRDIQFQYPTKQFSIIDTGYFIRLNPKDVTSSITVDGTQHKLVEFHFHTPSEHSIDTTRYPMEAHFVHKNKDHVAVIGVLFEQGAHNDALETIIANIPAIKNQEKKATSTCIIFCEQ